MKTLLITLALTALTFNALANETPYEREAEIIQTGLSILGLDAVTVKIYPMPANVAAKYRKKNVDVYAFLQEFHGSYTLFINPALKTNTHDLAHELIHVLQHEEGKLHKKGNDFNWNGKEYKNGGMEYTKRPWEIEADKRAGKLARMINEALK